ncbi:MAG TPA: phosphoglucomutase [Acidilobales archaeon]|nr:phosphoglucomutase [Acidilobales archaeon]
MVVGIPKFFGTAGIRGRYLDVITPDLAFKIGLSYGTYLGHKGKVIVGHDVRLTSPLLKELITSGFIASGLDVYDVGLAPISITGYAIKKLKLSGGIYVTASHNPPEDNGFKIFNSLGSELLTKEEEQLEDILLEGKFSYVEWNHVGKRGHVGFILKDYVEDLVNALRPDKVKYIPKIVVDAVNGAAGAYTPTVLRRLGVKVLALNTHPDGTFPSRMPEPRPDVLEPMMKIMDGAGYDMLYAHDGDGDRLAVLIRGKGFIKQDRVIALFAYHKLLDKKGYIVVSVDCGNAVKEVVESMGGKLVIYRLGKTYEKALELGLNNVLLAAEPWKFIDPKWGLWADGIYQATYLTKIIMEEGKPLHELLKQVPDYPQARISVFLDSNRFKYEIAGKAIEYLGSKAPSSATLIEIDGLRVNYEDNSWILVRPSGTEPKIRIYCESQKYDKVRSMVNEMVSVINKLAKERGVKTHVEGTILP